MILPAIFPYFRDTFLWGESMEEPHEKNLMVPQMSPEIARLTQEYHCIAGAVPGRIARRV